MKKQRLPIHRALDPVPAGATFGIWFGSKAPTVLRVVDGTCVPMA